MDNIMPFKAAVIGLGNIGLMYELEASREKPASHAGGYLLSSRFELVAAADINPMKSDVLKQIAPNVPFYVDYSQLLAEHDIDVVSVCTHPSERLDLLESIASHRTRLIFCEKPVVPQLSDIQRFKHILNKYPDTRFIPNLSRRWNSGILKVLRVLHQGELGRLQSIHVRYTRGIFNTGAHLFDLLKSFGGPMQTVQTIRKVHTSSEDTGEPSFSFLFTTEQEVSGYAEAFNDAYYYMFEIDLFCSNGKIEIYQSGDLIRYFHVDKHPLFEGFNGLTLMREEMDQLQDSNIKNALEHISDVLKGTAEPEVNFEDGIYPLYVADALLKSYQNNGALERVMLAYE